MEERGPRLSLPWKPKEWRPEYARVVALSCQGLSNTKIAELTSYTKQHVSNILNLDEAAEFRKQVVDKIKEKVAEDIPVQMERLQSNVVKRLNQAFEDEKLFENSPFALLDRGLRILEGKGTLNTKSGGVNVNIQNNQQSNVVLPTEIVGGLLAGLDRANEVQQIHNGSIDKT